MSQQFYSQADLARLWGKHRQQIQRWVADGYIRTVEIAGRKLVRAEDAVMPTPARGGARKNSGRKKRRKRTKA